jgi:hypothetical protein
VGDAHPIPGTVLVSAANSAVTGVTDANDRNDRTAKLATSNARDVSSANGYNQGSIRTEHDVMTTLGE